MTSRKVGISGRGIVTSWGAGIGLGWDALLTGKPAGAKVSFEGHGECFVGSLPGAYRPDPRIPPGIVTGAETGFLISLDAALQALDESGFGQGLVNVRRFAVVDGLAYRAPGQPVLFAGYGQSIARVLGVRGPVLEVAGAEASGAAAIVEGIRLVDSGEVDVALVGGGQAVQAPLLAQFAALGFSSAEPARPWDRGHNGCVLADGAAYLIVESESHAAQRGQSLLALVESTALEFDPSVEPLAISRAESAGRVQQRALASAGILQNQVDLVVSCADGRPGLDLSEAYGLMRTFGNHAGDLPVTTASGCVGQLLAGSGPLALVMATEALRRQTVFPVSGFVEGEPGVDLAYAAEAREAALERVLVTASGLGGTCAAFLVRSPGA